MLKKIALYQLIANEIFRRISQDEYHTGAQLPTQNELAKEFNVSRITIKKAMDVLLDGGFIQTNKKGGTTVGLPQNNFIFDSSVGEHSGVTARLATIGKLSSHIISFDIRQPSEIECQKLLIKEDELVYDIIRQRIFNDEPLLLEYTVMPVNVIPGLTMEVLEKSIYHHILNTLRLKFGPVNRRIRAGKPDLYDQKYLDCKEDDPVLEVKQVAFLSDMRPFEFSQTRHRYDKGEFYVNNLI